MEIRPIKTEEDYQVILAEVERLFNSTSDTPEGDRLDVLTTLLEGCPRNPLIEMARLI